MTEILNHYYQRHLQLVLRSCDYCMAKGPYRYDGVKDLEMRLSCIIWMGPKCNHKGPCVWEPRRSKEDVGEMVTKASGCHDETKQSWAKECRHPPEAGKGTETDPLPEPPEGAIPIHTLTVAQQNDSGLIVSTTVWEEICVFLWHGVFDNL